MANRIAYKENFSWSEQEGRALHVSRARLS